MYPDSFLLKHEFMNVINTDDISIILKYFPQLTEMQKTQFSKLYALYSDWNEKINVISRKDIEQLYERHVLHSLGIAKYIQFTEGTKILDVGTGGGFPGIPLAIMFPQCHFKLIDSIGKKILVASEIAKTIGLTNVEIVHENAKEEKGKYDFIVSRAVMRAGELYKLARNNIAREKKNFISNGIICLKGGDLNEEIIETRIKGIHTKNLKDYFEEAFFDTKKIMFIPFH